MGVGIMLYITYFVGCLVLEDCKLICWNQILLNQDRIVMKVMKVNNINDCRIQGNSMVQSRWLSLYPDKLK